MKGKFLLPLAGLISTPLLAADAISGSRPGARRAAQPSFVLPERVLQLLREARWILSLAMALFVLLVLVTYDRADPGWSHAVSGRTIHNAGGRVGAWIAWRHEKRTCEASGNMSGARRAATNCSSPTPLSAPQASALSSCAESARRPFR